MNDSTNKVDWFSLKLYQFNFLTFKDHDIETRSIFCLWKQPMVFHCSYDCRFLVRFDIYSVSQDLTVRDLEA